MQRQTSKAPASAVTLASMDPDETLFTFLLQTDPSVRFVHLFGSWDNFSTHYQMERDTRRGLGSWRGCHSFRDSIISIGDRAKGKKNGLKMGSTYYYYYELDGTKEVHDPSAPSTNACPLLPGQPLNTLEIPTEKTLRHRSTSLTSLRSLDFRTLNPRDRFLNPRPPSTRADTPCPPSRVGSSPLPKDISRAASPTPSWRRLLSFRKSKSDGDRIFGNIGRGRSMADRPITPASVSTDEDTPSILTSDEGSHHAREASPESMYRSRCDTPSPMSGLMSPGMPLGPTLIIPEDIAEENENDDDDGNFATSAASDHTNFFATSLSPPPMRPQHGRSVSTSAITTIKAASSATTPVSRPGSSGPSASGLTTPSRTLTTPTPRPRNQMSLPKLSVSSPCNYTTSSPVTSSVASSMSPRSPVDASDSLTPVVADQAFGLGGTKPQLLLSPLFGNFVYPGPNEEPLVDQWVVGVVDGIQGETY